MWSSARWVMSIAGVGRVVEILLDDRYGEPRSVESLDAAGQSFWAAEIGRVVDKSMSRF